MDALSKLVEQGAEQLGLQRSGPSPRAKTWYFGVTAVQSGVKSKWQARCGGKHLGLFDLEIEAALAVRVHHLQQKKKTQDEAKQFELLQKAVRRVAEQKGSILSSTCTCGISDGACTCAAKALREVEAAKAALQALRSVTGAPVQAAATASSGSSKPKAKAAKPAPAPQVEAPTAAEAPAAFALKLREQHYAQHTLETALLRSTPAPEPDSLAAAPVGPRPEETLEERLARLRREHVIQRRRGKDKRREERELLLRERLQKRARQSEPGEGDDCSSDETGAEKSDFRGLRSRMLADFISKKKKIRKKRVDLSLYDPFRVLNYWDAVDMLQKAALTASVQRRLQKEKNAMVNFSALVNPSNPFAMPDVPEADQSSTRRYNPAPDLALKRLVEERRQQAAVAEAAAEEAQAAAAAKAQAAAGEAASAPQGAEVSAMVVEVPTTDSRIEWMMLTRVEPKSTLSNLKLSAEEEQAVQEELMAAKAWEESGGKAEEEKLMKAWRRSIQLRRQSYLLRRGAARWIRGSKSSRPASHAQATQPHFQEPSAPAALLPEPSSLVATEDPYM
eukprot:TRINITY_DN49912_c0_g1_i1.p1 TRINITY_DN49912_c0_g1~~TRINITY_DN49912_c0_g1_i1.p1  ORF type:complete len:562 (-),score=151.63 TRINITY_DN49912_c0_g1_i1:81-1766(-)